MSTYADLIVNYLELLGIEYIFGVPGGAIEPLYNALARSERRGGIKAIVARHESGAAFMADGYARETGKIGVCCSTTGPGATNLITGVASAFADNVPMLVITAQTPLPKFGRRALQDSSCAAVDVVGMFRHCTRFNTLISHHEQVENKMISAIMSTHRIPNGPVHVSIPSDILRTRTNRKPKFRPEALLQDFAMSDNNALEFLCEELGKHDRIALFIGDGCSGASDRIMEFAELINAPFVTGPMGKRWVNERHELYRGVYGFAGHYSAKELIHEEGLELVLAIGAQLGELGTSGWNSPLLSEKLIHIDSSPEHFTRSPMARLHVCGKLDSIFERVIESVKQAHQWGRRWKGLDLPQERNVIGCTSTLADSESVASDAIPLKPQRIFAELVKNLPETTRLVVDAGNAWSWATHYYQRPEIHGEYRIAMGFGSMGWAISAAIGGAASKPHPPTLCITGDGSYLMSGQEITVAAQHQVPVVIMVMNDSALGMVMHGQRLGGAEQIGYELNQVDFALMAKSMGINGIRIETPEQLMAIDWDGLFSANGPTLIDMVIDPNETPPMGERVKGLANQQASATPGG